jgi:hypothetical protein
MLLDAGAPLAIRDSLLKSTALGWACRWGKTELVRLYLKRGTDAVEPDAEPWATPLAWATKRGHHEIVQRKRQDLPSSWGTPSVRLPCSVDAGRTAATRPLRCRSVAPGIRTTKAPTKGLSAFNSMAFGIAVYAS